MVEQEIPVINTCACQQERGSALLPAEGQHVRVTFQKDFHTWEGNKQVVIRAGTMYEGTATDIDPEGFFDVIDDEENRIQFFIYDSTIQLEIMSSIAA